MKLLVVITRILGIIRIKRRRERQKRKRVIRMIRIRGQQECLDLTIGHLQMERLCASIVRDCQVK